ncbi:MAG: helix-turn-helix domain-containing protein [bacterium]
MSRKKKRRESEKKRRAGQLEKMFSTLLKFWYLWGDYLSFKNVIVRHELDQTPCYNGTVDCVRSQPFFDNLPEILRPAAVAELLDVSIKTIYDWRYRQKTRNIPEDLFIKFNRFLYVRTSVLKKWINQQNNFLL